MIRRRGSSRCRRERLPVCPERCSKGAPVMMRKLLAAVTVAWPVLGVAAEPQRADPPFRVAAAETVKLVECGGILVENSRIRGWISPADACGHRTRIRRPSARIAGN